MRSCESRIPQSLNWTFEDVSPVTQEDSSFTPFAQTVSHSLCRNYQVIMEDDCHSAAEPAAEVATESTRVPTA